MGNNDDFCLRSHVEMVTHVAQSFGSLHLGVVYVVGDFVLRKDRPASDRKAHGYKKRLGKTVHKLLSGECRLGQFKTACGLKFLKHGTINLAQSIKGWAKDSAIAKLIELSRVISLSHTIEYPPLFNNLG